MPELGRERSVDDLLAGGVEVTVELGSLRPLRDGIVWLGRSVIPFRGWIEVPHSDPDSASSALNPRSGEPPNAAIVRNERTPRVSFISRMLHRTAQ